MTSKKDISCREDIECFIQNFYKEVMLDDTIGIIFTEIVPINWAHHIPVITDFWESVLLDNPVYKNNAMAVHYALNDIFPLKPAHFEAWLKIFYSELDRLYDGPVSELAKKRAKSIADLMLYKMTKTSPL